MTLLVAVVLGLVQAATEFLPVSSTAHLLVFGELLGQRLSDEQFRAFVTIIQTGTTLAVILFFREELYALTRAALRGLARGKPLESGEARLAWLIVLGTIPAAVAGKLLERRIEALGNLTIAFSLVVWGLILLAAERLARHRRTIEDVGLADALAIGCGQALALVPGTSRSGATITTGMALGLKREDAARFSFLLSVPITLGAGLYKLKKALPALSGQHAWAIATVVGTLTALFAGYLVIGWLLAYLRTRTTYLFVAWRLVAGVLIGVLLWKGVLPGSDEAPAPAPVHAPAAANAP
ncbi:undecaprenyl-diphosphatase UppP [Anaeromyxobacter diazotrophicus]|uniref:Undecaprenyl-diphosphatase n=1 Tax=Anaeromyxobacter diazotrophicus TaxID=2590199 RepID=A0A7I9VRQ7_9BACT|nr:undecaprenyl-diphosphatase UppP [Anaeromyxobacter diazotrophicus]GEJ58617.1 undecaprenyl-diphosphatase [Anaeromyxobacter diazotrophicus]